MDQDTCIVFVACAAAAPDFFFYYVEGIAYMILD
ncbi:ferredoxin [Peribacillus butanolivorans]